MFESVLLPAPFSPSSACTSPAAASQSTASFATTPGKRLVIPCIPTAAPVGAAVGGAPFAVNRWLAGRLDVGDAADHALHEPLHRVQRVDPRLRVGIEAGPLRDLHLAALVVDRATELVPLAGHDLLL